MRYDYLPEQICKLRELTQMNEEHYLEITTVFILVDCRVGRERRSERYSCEEVHCVRPGSVQKTHFTYHLHVRYEYFLCCTLYTAQGARTRHQAAEIIHQCRHTRGGCSACTICLTGCDRPSAAIVQSYIHVPV